MVRKLALICGILAASIYVGSDILAASRYPGYSYFHQSVSELRAIGAPSRPLLVPILTLYAVLELAFGGGVWLSAGQKRALRITAGLLIMLGLLDLTAYFFPMHTRQEISQTGRTLNEVMHLIGTALTVLMILLIIGFGAAANGRWFRVYSVVTIVVLIVAGTWGALDAPQIEANLPTPWMGVKERINIYGYMLWLAVLALVLWRAPAPAAAGVPPGGWRGVGGLVRKEEAMTTIQAFIQRHSVLTYYVLTFVFSWGGILLMVGPGGFLGPKEPSGGLYLAMLVGPSLAGLLLTGLVHGKTGYRALLARLLRRRVSACWYTVALLTAPLAMMAVLFTLSLTSPVFLPGIVTTDDKASLLLTGLVAGLMVGIFEELGWTGFTLPRLRLRYGILATGLIMGLLHGAWHFPLFVGSGSSSGTFPPALSLSILLFSFLPPFRVLMVWVYDRTESLLVAMLMHLSLTAGTLILQPLATGTAGVTYDLVLAAALWVFVAAVAVANHGQISRPPLRSQMA